MGAVATSLESAAGQPLFAGYPLAASGYDELFSAPGQIRPHWQPLVRSLEALGTAELNRRWEQAQRMLYENGITYNIYEDAPDRGRPWELDPLPLVIPSDQWQVISAGLVQRATLLDRVLADLYGPQSLLADGSLPAEWLWGHPGFLRSYHGQRPPGDRYLHIYAADLVRGADGRWMVVSDRTEAPSGAGYALESRIVVSRMLPGVIHDCQVERLASYFMALRETLVRLAPRHRGDPRIVLLSPGPSNPNYFEDAYLARYLGYSLVEGGDLAVRHDRVLIKTLAGLVPVDVILRRIDDADCDPLELRGDSLIGVAGLLQVARSGNLVVANSIGSGLVESPGLMAFLPSLCRRLLGQDLLLPAITTWWCGQAEVRQQAISNLVGKMVGHAYRRGRNLGASREPVTQATLEQCALAIRHKPTHYVVQEPLARSTAPIWAGGKPQPRHVALRVYLVASGEGYICMPGGLARYAAAEQSLDGSLAGGEGSKDVWVLSQGPVRHVTLLQPLGQPLELRRSGAELPSRVADNLLWLGRHVERAENAARLLRTILSRLTSESQSDSLPEVPVLLRALANQGQIEPGFVVEGIRDQMPDIEQALPASVFDEQQVGSLRSTLVAMHRTASAVRDRLSIDSWRILNRIHRDFRPPRRYGGVDISDVLARINQMIIDLAAFSGLVMESMTRGHGWRFLDIGRRLERALHMMGLLQSALVDCANTESPVLEAVLEVADSSMTYRSRYLNNLQVAPVLDLLLIDETNPRSLAYQLVALLDHVEQLPQDRSRATLSPEQRLAMSILHSVRMIEATHLAEVARSGQRGALDQFLSKIAHQLPRLADAISHKYLIHAGALRQLEDLRPDEAPRSSGPLS